jgi:hypothetical protein
VLAQQYKSKKKKVGSSSAATERGTQGRGRTSGLGSATRSIEITPPV